MGRPRKSIQDHLRDGTYRADRHGPLCASSPDPGDGAAPPKMPGGLPVAVQAKWAALARILAGVARERDADTLLDLARWLARQDAIAAELDAALLGEKAAFRRELVQMAGTASDKVLRLSERFGLTPADRAKLKPEGPAGPAKPKVATRPQTALDRKGK